MKSFKVSYLAILLLVGCRLAAQVEYSEKEWRIRPWEIIKGQIKPHSDPLWVVDKDSIDGWKVSGAGGEISKTSVTKLWGNEVAKVTFPKGGSLTITPGKPIEVPKKVDGFDLWIFGPINGPPGAAPKIDLQIVDADNKNYKLRLSGTGSRWDYKRWWGMGAVFAPETMKFPARITAIRVSGLTTRFKNDFFCIDQLGGFQYTPAELPDTSKWDVPFPVTTDGIMPQSMGKNGKNAVSQKGNSYIFNYHGDDAKLSYTYTPTDGTLGDIVTTFNGKTFRTSVNGGIHAKVGKVEFKPGDKEIKSTLLDAKLDNDKLQTNWRWEKGGEKLNFSMQFRIKGKTLEVITSSPGKDNLAFDCGYTENTPNARLTGFGYLHNRWDEPQFLITDDYIVSCFLDWYSSESSCLVETVGTGGVKGAAVLSENSARIMGGSLYQPKTNKERNPLYEKMFITVGTEVKDVFPVIANPPSRFLPEMAKTVCMTRMYCQQENYKQDQINELNFWRKMEAWGCAQDMCVRFHEGKFRTPLENNRFCRSMDGGQSLGGDETLISLVKGMRKYVKWVGVYNNPRIVAANAPEFEYRYLVQNSSREFINGWDGCFRPKTMITYKWNQEFVPKFKARYGWTMEYLDELDNAPPWADVDFDHHMPNAGKFNDVYRNYGLIALQQKELYNGPIWSEGCAAYFFAGLTDIDYAVSNEKVTDIPLVDFKQNMLNTKNAYTGTTWSVLHSGNVDLHLATEIAYANVGSIVGKTAPDESPGLTMQGLIADLKYPDILLKSFFMIRQLQEYYVGLVPDEILYEINGKFMTAGAMLRGNHENSGKIHVRYPNGLLVWVNRSAKDNWSVTVDGKEYILPPNGYAAFKPDTLLEYSALIDGHRADYVRGPLYTYMNGNGVKTAFPEMTVAGPYMLRKIDNAYQLIPEPFVKAETIENVKFSTVQPLDIDRKAIGESQAVKDGKIAITAEPFSYRLQ